MNILITSAGRRVSLIKAFQYELKKLFPDGKVIASDADPMLSAGCHVADAYFKVPRFDCPTYIASLIEQCKNHEISLIIPTIDTGLAFLAQHRQILTENGIIPIVSSLEFITICRDKRVIHNYFKEKSIRVALEYSRNDYKFPMFLKPYDGSRSADTYVIKKKEDLRDIHFNNDKLMFLEYLDPKHHEEFTCDLYYDKMHQLKCVVPRKRIEVRDGEVNKGVTQYNELVPFIRQHLGEIKGAVGCLTAQFFKHKTDNTICGIEINPRFGGGYPLSYLAGANFPKWIIEEYLLNKTIVESFDCWEADLLMIRYDDEILVHGYKD